MYPIGELIRNIITSKGVKRIDVVKAGGYMNTNKGLKHLDRCIHGEGNCSEKFVIKVLKFLEVDQHTIDKAIRKTKEKLESEKKEEERRREEYERKNFRPYIYIKSSESRPEGLAIVAFAGVGAYKHISCPEKIQGWPIEEQISKVREIIARHYRDKNGKCHHFGNITGYIYRKTYDDNIELSIDGEVIGISMGKFNEGPEPTLQIGGKVIVGGLSDIKPPEVEPDEQHS